MLKSSNFIMVQVITVNNTPDFCYLSTHTGAGLTGRRISRKCAMELINKLNNSCAMVYEQDKRDNVVFETWTRWHN